MFLSGTADARGFQQWKQSNRWVKKGARAIYILVPCIKRETDEETGEETETLRYFKASPVFAYEDTEGEPLTYEQVEVPELPLLEKARPEHLGQSRSRQLPVPGMLFVNPQRNQPGNPGGEGLLSRVGPCCPRKGQGLSCRWARPLQEIVAELSAQALCRLVRQTFPPIPRKLLRYIERYAGKLGLSPHAACLKVLARRKRS